MLCIVHRMAISTVPCWSLSRIQSVLLRDRLQCWAGTNYERIVKMKKTILLAVVVALVLTAKVTKADFTFGTPANLGSAVNSSANDGTPSVTADGLSLFFNSQRSGGYGHYDIWISTRQAIGDPWGEPENLGPTINTSYLDGNTVISADGLTLHFTSDRPGGYGGWDIYVTTRSSILAPWGTPVNLGPPFNTSASDHGISTCDDGLSLFFGSDRPGGFGNGDLYMSTRATVDDPWAEPVNLGPVVNSPSVDSGAMVSADGLTLFFFSNRPGGYGGFDVWVTRRAKTSDDWGTPVNLGPVVNTSDFDGAATISADGSTLYFMSGCPGGIGSHDLWKVSIEPVVDLNDDGIVDSADMCIIVDNWHTDNPLCDIAPPPLGDGFVDVKDLIVLAQHLFEDCRLIAHWQLDETEGGTAHDNAGDYNGTLHGGPVWQPAEGKIDGALQLDGIDDYVSTDFILNPMDGSFSVFAWIKAGSPGQVILSQANGDGWGSLWLYTEASGGNLMTGLMNPQPPLESESVITDSQWHHIGLVWDGSFRYLYVDGVEVVRDAAALSYGVPCNGGLYLGTGKSLDASTFFSGLIDDVRIYDVALPHEEIAALAN